MHPAYISIKLHPLFYITTIIHTLIIYIYPPISNHPKPHTHTNKPLFSNIKEESICQQCESSLLTQPRAPITFINDLNNSSLFYFRLIITYITICYTHLQPGSIFLLYDQYFSAPTPNTIQSYKLQHLIHSTHTPSTYNHTSFHDSLPTNDVPPSIQSYKNISFLSCNSSIPNSSTLSLSCSTPRAQIVPLYPSRQTTIHIVMYLRVSLSFSF